MRSFAIKEPGSPVPALYATLVADESKEICFAIQPGCQQVEISDIYVGSYFSISKYPAAKVVLTVW